MNPLGATKKFPWSFSLQIIQKILLFKIIWAITFLPEQVDHSVLHRLSKTSEATAENHFELWNTPSSFMVLMEAYDMSNPEIQVRRANVNPKMKL